MKIGQISPSDPVSALALEGLMVSAPILTDIEFYTKSGAADSVKKEREGATKTKITRSVNEDNTPTAPTISYESVSKKIVSFDAKVDTILEDRNEDPEEELAKQTKLEAIEAGWPFQELCFEGDSGVDGEDFDGMRNLVKSGKVKTVATDGLQVPVGNSDTNVGLQQNSIEALLQFFEQVRGGATHAYMNNNLRIRWVTIAKNLGYYEKIINELGQQIEKIGGVIIRGAGYKKDGTLLLPFNETVGVSTDCSSIFAVRYGEGIDFSALTSAGLKGQYAGQIGNFLINNVNMDMAFVLQDDSALWQSKGWRL